MMTFLYLPLLITFVLVLVIGTAFHFVLDKVEHRVSEWMTKRRLEELNRLDERKPFINTK